MKEDNPFVDKPATCLIIALVAGAVLGVIMNWSRFDTRRSPQTVHRDFHNQLVSLGTHQDAYRKNHSGILGISDSSQLHRLGRHGQNRRAWISLLILALFGA